MTIILTRMGTNQYNTGKGFHGKWLDWSITPLACEHLLNCLRKSLSQSVCPELDVLLKLLFCWALLTGSCLPLLIHFPLVQTSCDLIEICQQSQECHPVLGFQNMIQMQLLLSLSWDLLEKKRSWILLEWFEMLILIKYHINVVIKRFTRSKYLSTIVKLTG